MTDELLKALAIFVPTIFKFVIGPLAGYRAGLNFLTTVIMTVTASMTGVIAFAYFGNWIRTNLLKYWLRRQKKFTPRKRRMVMVWKKFGLAGLALLGPLLLTPIGSTIAAVSFGAPKERILVYMFASSVFFAFLFSILLYTFGETVLPDFLRPD